MSARTFPTVEVSRPRRKGLRFADPRLRVVVLEDGEACVPLGRRSSGIHASDQAHAGVWSATESYALLIPGRRAVGVAKIVLAFDPRLRVLLTDREVIVRGPDEVIERLITAGPGCCRARRKRDPKAALHLAGHRYEVAS